jgi:hypothetical protein
LQFRIFYQNQAKKQGMTQAMPDLSSAITTTTIYALIQRKEQRFFCSFRCVAIKINNLQVRNVIPGKAYM